MLFQAICSKINEHFYEQETVSESRDNEQNNKDKFEKDKFEKDKSKKVYKFPDLELGFGPIIDVESNINDKLSSQSFLDNCLSSVNYLTSPDKIGLNMNFSFMFEPEKYLKQEPKQKPEKNDTKSDKTDSYIIDI
jgi:hypothetical protein